MLGDLAANFFLWNLINYSGTWSCFGGLSAYQLCLLTTNGLIRSDRLSDIVYVFTATKPYDKLEMFWIVHYDIMAS